MGPRLCLCLCARVFTTEAKRTNEKGKTHHGWKSKAEMSTPTDRAEVELKLMHRGSQQAELHRHRHRQRDRPPNRTNEPTNERTKERTSKRANQPTYERTADRATEKIMRLTSRGCKRAASKGIEGKSAYTTVRCLHGGGRLKAGLDWKHHKRTEHKYKGKDQVVPCVYYFRHRHNAHAYIHTHIFDISVYQIHLRQLNWKS